MHAEVPLWKVGRRLLHRLKCASQDQHGKQSPSQPVYLWCSNRRSGRLVCRRRCDLGNLVRCRDTGKVLDSSLWTAERWLS